MGAAEASLVCALAEAATVPRCGGRPLTPPRETHEAPELPAKQANAETATNRVFVPNFNHCMAAVYQKNTSNEPSLNGFLVTFTVCNARLI
jgi:hypothetical protein